VKDETAQTEDTVTQTPEQKAEHERRMRQADERNKRKEPTATEAERKPTKTGNK